MWSVRLRRPSLLTALLLFSAAESIKQFVCGKRPKDQDVDVVIYRATPAGISAAIASATTSITTTTTNYIQRPLKVLLLEPTNHVGGMATEGGIGLRDALNDDLRSNPNSTQYRWGRLNAQHYLQNHNSDSNPIQLQIKNSAVLWQPDHWVGEQSFWKLLNETTVKVHLNTDLVEGPSGVRIENGPPRRIAAIQIMKGNHYGTNVSCRCWITAKYFIDASYEGDLMQAAGVSFTVGRESNATYNESWAGVTNHSESQFPLPIDPLDEHGQLLRYIQQPEHANNAAANDDQNPPWNHLGAADHNVMAYSYRVCLTQDADRVPITPPLNYNPADFELARRLVLAELRSGKSLSQPWLYLDYMGYSQIPERTMKYDACCGFSPVGIDATGLAVGYATATRETRAQMAAEHRYYVQGLLWFWQSDPSLPKEVRTGFAQYGLCPDAWPDNGHFPRQLYVREAARMVGDKVFTQQDRQQQGQGCRQDSIAMGSWGFDIHEMQRVAFRIGSQWMAWNEGSTGYRQGDHDPFEIPYWIMLPKRKEITNLLVPNCPSVSHVAFAAVRVEPTLWQLGVAAGTAVAMSARSNGSPPAPLHDVNISELQQELLKQGSPIHWNSSISVCEGFDVSLRRHHQPMFQRTIAGLQNQPRRWERENSL